MKVKEALEDGLKLEVAAVLEEVQFILRDANDEHESEVFFRVSELVNRCKLVGWC